MDHLIELGKAIRITRKVFCEKQSPSQLCYHGYQYQRHLKVERQASVQVVLLQTLILLYQGEIIEVDSHHGGRETSEGSLVSCRSKDDMAGDEPLPSSSVNQLWNCNVQNIKNNKGEVLVSCV